MQRIAIIIAIALVIGMAASPVFADGWYDSQWQYRQRVVISRTMAPSDQANFPVLIKITDQNNPIFGKAQANGNDILFTSSDGTTKLAHEIETYTDSGTKELNTWVKVPGLSGTNTISPKNFLRYSARCRRFL